MTDHGPSPATPDDVAADVAIDIAAGTITIPYALLVELVDPDECRYDHHDYCQTHNLGERPCEHAIGQAIIARCAAAVETT